MAVSQRTRDDLARAERRRLIEEAGRARKSRDAREVREGVSETVALGEARGEEFSQPKAGRGEGDKPTRRLTGIEALVKAEKLKGTRLAIAQSYGHAYRTVQGEARIRSCLGDTQPGGEGVDVSRIGLLGRRRVLAGYRLADMRRALRDQTALVDACDAVLGQEMTPREAGGNALGSAVYTALVLVAVDLMAAALNPTPAAALAA